MWKRTAACVISAVLAVSMLASCAHSAEGEPGGSTNTQTASESPEASPTPVPEEEAEPGEVLFVTKPGFYNAEVLNVELKAAEGYTIYYTTDCSTPIPGESGTYQYTGPIALEAKNGTTGADDAISVIRAAAEKDGEVYDVVTGSFIVNRDTAEYSGRYGSLPVFSISTDSENLFGDTGIYTNYTEHGRETERVASVEYFDENGERQVGMDAGIRIYGGTSRGIAQKAFKITARKQYGTAGKFKYTFFDDNYDESGNLITSYDSIVLRCGGSDSLISDARATFMRDPLLHKLALPISNITGMDGKPVVLYLNGAYWGIYYLREAINDDYIESHYDVDKENVDMIYYGYENGNWLYKVDNGSEDAPDDYVKVMTYISSHEMKYDRCYDYASELIDMDNFAKYFAINVYINNRDWPHNNMTAWKYSGTYDESKPYTDGKWRWLLKDIDCAWARLSNADESLSMDAKATSYLGLLTEGYGSITAAAFSSLLKNDEFKALFTNCLCDMMNEYYKTDRAISAIDNLRNLLFDEMKYHVTCVWPENYSIQANLGIRPSTWDNRLRKLRSFAEDRPGYIITAMQEYLNAGHTVTVNVKCIGGSGTAVINSITKEAAEGFSWSGTYMSNMPLIFSAVNSDGTPATVKVASDTGYAVYGDGKIYFNTAESVSIEISFK